MPYYNLNFLQADNVRGPLKRCTRLSSYGALARSVYQARSRVFKEAGTI